MKHFSQKKVAFATLIILTLCLCALQRGPKDHQVEDVTLPIFIGEEPLFESSGNEETLSLVEQDGQRSWEVTSYFNHEDITTILDALETSGAEHQIVRYLELDGYLGCIMMTKKEVQDIAQGFECADEIKSVVSALPCVAKESTIETQKLDDSYIIELCVTLEDIEKLIQRQSEPSTVGFHTKRDGYDFRLVINANELKNLRDKIVERHLNGFVYSIGYYA